MDDNRCPICKTYCFKHLDARFSSTGYPVYRYEPRDELESWARTKQLWEIIDSISRAVWDRNDIHKSNEDKMRDLAAIFRDPAMQRLRKNHSTLLDDIYASIREKDARIKSLEEDLMPLQGWPEMDEMRQSRDEAIAKWQKMKRLIPKLTRNLDHLNSCGIWTSSIRACTCGMNDLREELTELGY